MSLLPGYKSYFKCFPSIVVLLYFHFYPYSFIVTFKAVQIN